MTAPYDQQDRRVREAQPGVEIPHTSYMPEVTRVPLPPRVRKRRKTSRVIKIHGPWLLLLGIVILIPVLVLVIALAFRRPGPEPQTEAEAPILYITATPIAGLAQTATSILPPEYFLALSQTPLPEESATPDPAATIPLPTVTPAFVQLNPAGQPFSLEASQIVYVCYVNGSDEICLMNADGSNQRQLTSIPGTDWYPSLSPDGGTIVFSSQRGNGPFDIYAMSTSGGDIRRLTRGLGDNYAPEISPDGSRIVFTSTFGPEDDQNIWLMNADGSNPIQVTDSAFDDIDPSWSPDGTQISYASNRGGTKELFIMNADGSNIRQLTTGVSIGGRNDWTFDGRWLTFYAGPGSDKDIFIIPIECANIGAGCDRSLVQQLTSGGSNKGPSFSPDGQWITFASARDGDNEILIMRLDGSDVRQLTFNSIADWQPRW